MEGMAHTADFSSLPLTTPGPHPLLNWQTNSGRSSGAVQNDDERPVKGLPRGQLLVVWWLIYARSKTAILLNKGYAKKPLIPFPICEPWCWNMHTNICPCPKSPSFAGFYIPASCQWEFQDPTDEGTVPYKAIFCGDIPLHRPYIGLIYIRHPPS